MPFERLDLGNGCLGVQGAGEYGVRAAVLSAALLTVALVLGEFTLASLLNFPNLQVAVNLIGKRDAALSIAVSLAALLLAFALLLALSTVAGRRRTAREVEPLAPPTEGRP